MEIKQEKRYYQCTETKKWFSIVVNKPFINPNTGCVTTSESHMCVSEFDHDVVNLPDSFVQIDTVDHDYSSHELISQMLKANHFPANVNQFNLTREVE